MELLGFGEYFVVFIGPLIPPLLVIYWFLTSKKGGTDK
jgi:hypothetical protein